MLICTKCRTVYPQGTPACTRDGEALRDARDYADAEGDPLLGRVLADRYRIIERVGVGAMGNVYRAIQEGLNRSVGVKVLKREMAWDRETVARFHREAKAMSVLAHPNTVRVFDFGETEDGRLFLVMELLNGETITETLARDGRMSVPSAVRTIQQILAALHEAHAHGIIHRDLKPDNIFLARVDGHAEPVVKVLDFGIAKAWQPDKRIDDLETQAGTVFGTPRYMSPEQAQGKDLDPRSDLYTVACLLYQMITGRPLFTDDDAVVVMAKHIREAPIPLHEVAPDQPVPPRLAACIERALAKDPRKRFQDADDFLDELNACVPDIETAVKQGHGARSAGWLARASRSPRLAVSLGAGILVVAISVGLLVVFSSDASIAGNRRPSTIVTEQQGRPAADEPEPAHAVLESTPPGATVRHGSDVLGSTPLSIRMATNRPLIVTLELEGFEPATAELIADNRVRVVQLLPRSEDIGEVVEADEAPEVEPPATSARPRPDRRRDRPLAEPIRNPPPPPPRRSGPATSRREPYEIFD